MHLWGGTSNSGCDAAAAWPNSLCSRAHCEGQHTKQNGSRLRKSRRQTQRDDAWRSSLGQTQTLHAEAPGSGLPFAGCGWIWLRGCRGTGRDGMISEWRSGRPVFWSTARRRAQSGGSPSTPKARDIRMIHEMPTECARPLKRLLYLAPARRPDGASPRVACSAGGSISGG